MDWGRFVGHDRQRKWFRHAIASHRLGSGMLFVGPAGIGKRTFAILLAKTLFCERVPADEFAPCGVCPSCLQVDGRTHPDLLLIAKQKDRNAILIEQIVGDRDHRGQEGLCHDLHLTPQQANRRIAIIDDADFLNPEAANAMLKTLEEPPKGAILILVGTSPQRQLPTIRSRCQVVRFDSPSIEESLAILTQQGHATEPSQLRSALELSGGDLEDARRMLDPDACEFRERLSQALAEVPPQAIPLARALIQYVDGAGTEAAAKRDRIREAMLVAIAAFRKQIRDVSVTPQRLTPLISRLERTLQGLQQVDRNANPTTLLECWAIDLQQASVWDPV
jgi:DNA polymerase-3 subunit delta'